MPVAVGQAEGDVREQVANHPFECNEFIRAMADDFVARFGGARRGETAPEVEATGFDVDIGVFREPLFEVARAGERLEDLCGWGRG